MFCRYCGKHLADGEECDCREAVAARAAAGGRKEAPEPEASTGPAGGAPVLNLVSMPRRPGRLRVFFRNVWQCFRSYFSRPVPTLAISARIRDWQTGLFWAVVQAVMAGLCGMALVGGISTAASATARSALTASTYNATMMPSNIGSMILAYLFSRVHIQYFILFLILFVGSLLGTLGLSTAGYGWSAALHRRRPFLSLLAAVGVSSIPSACLTALAAIFCLFWPAAGIFLLIAAAVSLAVNTYVATKTACEADDSRLVLYYGISAAVVVMIVVLIVGNFLPAVVG